MALKQYATLDEADEHLAGVLNTEPWDLSTDVLRTKALMQATRSIQALNVPSYDDVLLVPEDFKIATTEIALKLLDGFDPEVEIHNAGIKSLGFDKLQQTNKSEEIPLHILAGIPSIIAFNILRAHMPDITTIHLGRAD